MRGRTILVPPMPIMPPRGGGRAVAMPGRISARKGAVGALLNSSVHWLEGAGAAYRAGCKERTASGAPRICISCAHAPPCGGSPARIEFISARINCMSNPDCAVGGWCRNASISGAPGLAGRVRNCGRITPLCAPCSVSCCRERSVWVCLRNCESVLVDVEHSAPDNIDWNAMVSCRLRTPTYQPEPRFLPTWHLPTRKIAKAARPRLGRCRHCGTRCTEPCQPMLIRNSQARERCLGGFLSSFGCQAIAQPVVSCVPCALHTT